MTKKGYKKWAGMIRLGIPGKDGTILSPDMDFDGLLGQKVIDEKGNEIGEIFKVIHDEDKIFVGMWLDEQRWKMI